MKKLVCIFLTAAMCFSLCGCVQEIAGGGIKLLWSAVTSVPQWEQRAMLKHLEKKYDEKFVIKEILYPSDESSLSRGAIVYPEGKEEEEVYVSLGTKGNRTCIDNYDVMLHSNRLFPIYDEWIRGVLPYAKVAVQLSGYPQQKIKYYNPQQPIQEFIDEAKGLDIEINILLNGTALEQKDDIFKAICDLPETEPLNGFQIVDYRIGFMEENAFKSIKTGEYKQVPGYLKPLDENDIIDKDFVAITSFAIIKNYPLPEYLDQLNRNFEIKEETQ